VPEPPVEGLGQAEQRTVLGAFARALTREAHHLARWPTLMWPQLYNRLQWEGASVAEVLRSEFDRRTTPEAPGWMRSRWRVRESEALVRTLGGHTSIVTACAISPDGSFIVSASWDRTLKVWEAQNGQEFATLTGHTAGVWACAISPDGRSIVSASWDRTLQLWDAQNGQ
jgi:WD40 repeat protein